MVLGNWQRSRGRNALGLSSQRNKEREGRSKKGGGGGDMEEGERGKKPIRTKGGRNVEEEGNRGARGGEEERERR